MRRPALQYHGGKFKLAKWIISHFPAHKVYTEVFGGAASVLLQKAPSYAEIYNDLDGEIVGFFQVLRDPAKAAILRQNLELTPFARSEFLGAYQPSPCPVEQARRTVIKAFMGFGSAAITGYDGAAPTGFRSNSTRSGTTPAHDWKNYPRCIEHFTDRLRGVVIESREATQVLNTHDSPETLHYVDPPYVFSTRSKTRKEGRQCYRHEMDDAAHGVLAEHLRSLSGMVVLSGYRCELYDKLYDGWLRIDRQSFADGALKRTESLWLSPSVANKIQLSLEVTLDA